LLAGEEAVGFFFLDNLTPYAYTERDLELLEPVAQQLALAIQNSRLLKELQEQSRELARSVEELKVLREVGQAVNSTLDLPTVLTRIVAHAVQLSESDAGIVYEYDEVAEEFVVRATHGMEQELVARLKANPTRPGEGAVGRAAVERTPVAFADIGIGSDERLRSLMMHAAVGTAIGGVMTQVGEPQNLLIAAQAEWTFGEFFREVAPVSLPVAVVGLLTCWLVERRRWFGYGTLLPDNVRMVLCGREGPLTAWLSAPGWNGLPFSETPISSMRSPERSGISRNP